MEFGAALEGLSGEVVDLVEEVVAVDCVVVRDDGCDLPGEVGLEPRRLLVLDPADRFVNDRFPVELARQWQPSPRRDRVQFHAGMAGSCSPGRSEIRFVGLGGTTGDGRAAFELCDGLGVGVGPVVFEGPAADQLAELGFNLP